MKCEQVRDMLSGYLDNMLATEERQSVETHLRTCNVCRQMLAELQHFDSLLAQMPRISPSPALRQKIFSSPDYLELTGTFGVTGYTRRRSDPTDRPRLIALPGGLDQQDQQSPSFYTPSSRLPSSDYPTTQMRSLRHTRMVRRQRVLQIFVAASILLVLGAGAFLWGLGQTQGVGVQSAKGITPPAGLSAGPIPAGTRFVFLRDGALWSAPTDGGSNIIRLTPQNVTVAMDWAVRTPLPGRPAGNMLAYIDLQQGYVHTIRSDGQSDTVIQQPLLKPGIAPSSVWDTSTGTAILSSLSWSRDGSMLAFAADPKGTSSPNLYIYSLGSGQIHEVPLPIKGAVSHPTWSPDGVRIAFVLTHGRHDGILDYNTQNNGILTIASTVNTAMYPNDTVLTLDWSPNGNVPTITWSVGSIGHVHSIWLQRVGVASNAGAYQLNSGDNVEAIYNRAGNNGVGGWLVVTAVRGLPGDVLSVTVDGLTRRLTNGKRVSFAQWSPNGKYVSYFDGLSSGFGAFHITDIATGADTLVANNVMNTPLPTWSADSQRLACSTGTHVLVINTQGTQSNSPHPLKLQGPATALSWSEGTPNHLVMAMSDGKKGIYLVDTQHDTWLELDTSDLNGPIYWTQIP
jgi:hypothetical protein